MFVIVIILTHLKSWNVNLWVKVMSVSSRYTIGIHKMKNKINIGIMKYCKKGPILIFFQWVNFFFHRYISYLIWKLEYLFSHWYLVLFPVPVNSLHRQYIRHNCITV